MGILCVTCNYQVPILDGRASPQASDYKVEHDQAVQEVYSGDVHDLNSTLHA